MKKRNKKEDSVHDKAIRLLEGGLVEIDNLVFSIEETDGLSGVCECCQLDSICSRNIQDVCAEADSITHTQHKMVLH